MKFASATLLFFLLPTLATAFTTTTTGRSCSFTSLSMVNSAEAVKAAMAASKEFGSTSEEARAAWDIVEEIDAANSHSQKTSAPAAEEKEGAASTGNEAFEIKTSVEALAAAKKITEEKGIASPDARIAWELVEELAATETHHRTTGSG